MAPAARIATADRASPPERFTAMPDTETPAPDFTKYAVGGIDPGLLSGQPADAVRRFLFARAGFGPDSAPVADLADVRFGHDHARDGAASVVSDPFPPEGYDGPLSSLADWLKLVKDNAVSKTEVKAAVKDGAEPTAPVSPPPAPEEPPAALVAPGPDLTP